MAQMNVGGGSTRKPATVSVVRKPPVIKPAPVPVKKPVGNYVAATKKVTSYKPAPKPKPAPVKPAVKKNYEVLASNKGLPMTGVSKSTSSTAAKTTSSGGGGGGYSGGGGGGGGSYGGGGSASGGGGATMNLAPAYNPMNDPTYLASLAKLNDLWSQASGYKGQIDGMMTSGFSYDPETDASYKSLQTLATKQAAKATTESMEAMSDRGILNSTVTSDRAGQIAQTAQDAVTAQVPGLKNAAYGMYMDKLSTLNNLWNSTVAQAQQERGFSEDKRRWELGYQMDVNQFNTSTDQWNKTFDYNAAQADIQNAFKNQEYDMNYLSQIQDSVGVNNKAATNAALAELLKLQTKQSVLDYMRKNIGTYYSGGVNFSELLTALNKYFPGIETEAKNNKLL
jgi:hypothetical protein